MYQMLQFYCLLYDTVPPLTPDAVPCIWFATTEDLQPQLVSGPDNCLAKCGSPICAVANCGQTKPLGRGQGKAVYSGKGGHPVPQQGTGTACFTPAKPTKIFLVL
jgi:hypothetical protein